MLVWRIKQLISFYLSATTIYQVHAPYLYSILENCIEKRGSYPSIQKIEQRRKACMKSDITIEKKDYGEGKDSRMVSLKSLAKVDSITPSKGRFLYHLVQWLSPFS